MMEKRVDIMKHNKCIIKSKRQEIPEGSNHCTNIGVVVGVPGWWWW